MIQLNTFISLSILLVFGLQVLFASSDYETIAKDFKPDAEQQARIVLPVNCSKCFINWGRQICCLAWSWPCCTDSWQQSLLATSRWQQQYGTLSEAKPPPSVVYDVSPTANERRAYEEQPPSKPS
ncbi:hypothetical protein CHUAL_000706 [Chamberlinius hualienensis]